MWDGPQSPSVPDRRCDRDRVSTDGYCADPCATSAAGRQQVLGHIRRVGVLAAVGALIALVGLPTRAAGQLEDTGAFVIDKVLEGDALLRGPVTIAVSCSNGREETITFAEGVDPTEQVIGGLAPGTTCRVTEPVDGSNTAVGVSTTGVPAEVIADASVTPTVRVVNTYAARLVTFEPPPGSLTINKVLQGDSDLRGDIQIRVQCTQTPGFPDGTFDETQTIPAGVDPVPPLVFSPIPAPADCTVTETVTGANGAVDAIVIGEQTVRVTPNSNVVLTLTDDYTARTGSLLVRKVVDGPGAALRGDVVLAVSCTDGTTRTLVVPTARTASEQVITPIVAGSVCTVTETGTGAVPDVVDVEVSPPAPQDVTIIADTASIVTVTNTYTAASATLQVSKVVAGPAAGGQGEVVVDVICADGTAESFTVAAGTPGGRTDFSPLTVPFGTSCAVTETATGATAAVGATTTFIPGPVVDVEGPTTVVVTNTYTPAPGGLVVTKVVTGDGAGLRGPVTVDVLCDGSPAGSITYAPGAELEPLEIAPLPAGASCTLTESSDGGIPGVVDVTTLTSPAQPVVIPAGTNTSVTVTNTYTSVLGSLTVVKETAGLAEFRGQVTIEAVCTPPTGDPVTAIESYPPRSPLPPLVVGGLPSGTQCVVTEPENGSTPALAVTTTPTLPQTVTIEAEERETVTITNTYTPIDGSLTVIKQITGTVAGQQGPIAITATCGGTPTTFPIPASALTAPPFTITGLPAGTTCVIAEPVDGSSAAVDVTTTPSLPITVTIPAGGSATATLANQYEPAPASLTVGKTITGDAAADHGLIVILVDCGPQHSRVMRVSAGGTSAPPVVLDGLPAPITCDVIELLDGATDDVEVMTTGTGEVTVGPGEEATVTVNDDYQPRPATLVVTKEITGDAAGQHGPIEITATCDGTTTTFEIPAGVSDPEPFTLDGIAPGVRCTIDEPVDGSSAAVVVATSPDLPLTVGPFPAGGTLATTITNDYIFLTGRLLVDKLVVGPAADARGAIRIEVNCTDGTTASITYAPTDPLTALDVGTIPFGTTCTITEPVTGAIGDVIVDGPAFDPGAVVTIDASVDIVMVTNTYSFAPGTVELVKELEGPAVTDRGTVRLRWTCDEVVTVFEIPPSEAGPVTVFQAEVPSRTTCRAIELNNGATSGVAVTTAVDPPDGVVTAIAGQTVRATVTNTYTEIPTGNLLVESILTGPAEPQRDIVRLTVTCDSGRTVTLTVPPGQSPDPALVGGLPSGTQCTITQPLDGDTPSILTTTSGLPATPVDVVVGEPATVQVTNIYTDQVTPTTSPPTTTPPPTTTTSPPPVTSTTTPPPAPTPPASPGSSGSGGRLPVTGSDLSFLIIGAAGALSLGVGLRRSEHRTRPPRTRPALEQNGEPPGVRPLRAAIAPLTARRSRAQGLVFA